jgi:hypothetical protein
MFPIPSALAIKLGVYAGMAAAVVFAGWMVVHTIQQGAIKNIVAQDTAHAAQVNEAGAKIDAAQSNIDAKSAEDSAAHQTHEAQAAAVIKQKVYIHVHDPVSPHAVGCVSVGLVRQHDAAALGVDPDTLPLPSGVTDDACSATTNAELAGAIADNYAAARANAAQLNDLIANVKGKVDATAPKQ